MQQMLLNDRGEPVPDPATTPAVIPGTLIGHWLQMHEKLVQGDLLDLGAGNQPYASWYQTRIDRAVAVDFNAAVGLQARCAGEALPFANHSFDVVLATEVLEHIPRPELAVAEMVRVLRPGGSVLITTPFIYPVHEAPYDFWRFTHLT
jgi:ubiquinone/menaquinone biosynthesis C-methylase UbiE